MDMLGCVMLSAPWKSLHIEQGVVIFRIRCAYLRRQVNTHLRQAAASLEPLQCCCKGSNGPFARRAAIRRRLFPGTIAPSAAAVLSIPSPLAAHQCLRRLRAESAECNYSVLSSREATEHFCAQQCSPASPENCDNRFLRDKKTVWRHEWFLCWSQEFGSNVQFVPFSLYLQLYIQKQVNEHRLSN